MFTYVDVALVPCITGLVEIAKKLGMGQKYAPLLALLLGVVAGVLYAGGAGDIKGGILKGIFFGLSSSGLYSTAKLPTKKE